MKYSTIYYQILGVFSVVVGGIASALGGFDVILKFLVTLMAIDYLTGLIIAIVWKKSPKTSGGGVESHQSVKGLFRKGGMLLVVYLGVQLDLVTGTDFVRNMVIMFFIGNEGISVMENLGIMGVKYPPFIANAFEVLKERNSEAEVIRPEVSN